MEPEIAAGAKVHPVITALEKADEPTVVIHGYRGTTEDTVVRLYQALDTSAYVEIPKEGIVYLEEEKDGEPGSIRAFVRATSEILTVRRHRVRAADWARVRVADWPQLPPLEPRPSFWTCAGGCEAVFAARATQILLREANALANPDAMRQQELLFQIAQDKFDAKRALFFCLSSCVDTYGAPPFMSVPDATTPGGFRVQRFSMPGYHQMLVERYLEKPA